MKQLSLFFVKQIYYWNIIYIYINAPQTHTSVGIFLCTKML